MSETITDLEKETSKDTPKFTSKRLWWIFTAIFLITIGRDVLISPPQYDDQFSAIGFFAWCALSVVLLLIEKHKVSKLVFSDYYHALSILALAFIPVWRTEELVFIPAILLSVALLLAMLLSSDRSYLVEGTLLGVVVRFFSTIGRGFQGLGASFQTFKQETPKERSRKTILSILFGLLLALPWVVVFLALFSSADAVFQKGLQHLFEIISIDLVFRLIVNLFWLVVISVFFFGYLRNLETKPKKFKTPTFLGNIEVAIVLGTVILIFLSFIAVQFRYFFGGEQIINIDGYTYAAYARRGTTELIFASALAIGMLQLLKFFKKQISPASDRIFKIGYGLLIVEIGIVLISAYRRLRLLENTYGVTSIRITGHVFIITMAIFLIALYLDELLLKQNHLLFLLSTWATVFIVTLAALNMPAMAVRINQNVHGDAGIDWYYLRSLPDEGIPALIESLKSQEFDQTQIENPKNQVEYEKMLAELSCRDFENQYFLGQQVPNSRWYWRIDMLKALKATTENQDLWANYPVQTDLEICEQYSNLDQCFVNQELLEKAQESPWHVFYVDLTKYDQTELQERLESILEEQNNQNLSAKDIEIELQYLKEDYTRYYCDINGYRDLW